jgi:hypothetical protein
MLSGQVTFPRFIGTAPGTATFTIEGANHLGASPLPEVPYPPAPDPFPYTNPIQCFPTQAVWEPDPNTDNVKIALPPNQWATGPVEMRLQIPVAQRAMGPVANDLALVETRSYNNLPTHRGWIQTDRGTVYNLQGARGMGRGQLGQMSTAEKWAITASVISAVALGTTTILAVLNYRKNKRR